MKDIDTNKFKHSGARNALSPTPASLLAPRFICHSQSGASIAQVPQRTLEAALEAMHQRVASMVESGATDIGGAVYDCIQKRVVASVRPVGTPVTPAGRSMLALLDDPEWIARCIEHVASYVRRTPSKRTDGTPIWRA